MQYVFVPNLDMTMDELDLELEAFRQFKKREGTEQSGQHHNIGPESVL